MSLFIIIANVLALGAVADFGAPHCQPSTNVDRSTALDLTTSAPIAANGCYSQWFCSFCLIVIDLSLFCYDYSKCRLVFICQYS